MGALAIGVVVIAAVGLIFMSRQYHRHPGAVLAVILGGLTLIALAVFAARRRRQHA